MLSDAGFPENPSLPCPAGDPAAAPRAIGPSGAGGFPVLGPENALLRHVLEAIEPSGSPDAVGARSQGYNPLVFVGREGSGKSHCLDFIEKRWRASGASRIHRWDGESLVKEPGLAAESDLLHRIHQRFVTAELILVEGIDRVADRDVLTAFSHLLDRACESGVQVVVTLGHFPSETSCFPPSLASRLSAGLIVAVRMPEQESRRSVVRSIATRCGVELDESALARLAAADMPTAAIGTAIESLAASGCGRIEPSHAAGIIADSGPSQARPGVRRIISTTARHYGLQATQLLGPSRHKNVANARSTAIYLARRLTGKSLVELGRIFGGRDHTTVLHSIRVTRRRAENDPAWQRDIDDLLVRLG